MPPKKKAPTTAKPTTAQTQPTQPQPSVELKPIQPQQPQTKPVITASNGSVPSVIKTEAKKESGQVSSTVATSQKALTEEQILRMRREKFRVGNKLIQDEDPKVKEERMKKFGVQPTESREQIEQRKKKFANPSTILTEDEEVLRQRREKFAKSGALPTESAEVLQERKRKFARNTENLVDLDEQIAKSKSKKIHKPRDKFKRKRDRKERGFRRDRKHSSDGSRKSRKQIFGKKKFIRRSRPRPIKTQ